MSVELTSLSLCLFLSTCDLKSSARAELLSMPRERMSPVTLEMKFRYSHSWTL